MELFRIIKNDAKRAVRFCGGRSASSAVIIALVYLLINISLTVLLYFISGAESLYQSIFSLAETTPAVLAVTGAVSLLWFLIMPALLLGHRKLHLSFAEGNDESINLLFDMFSSFGKFLGAAFFGISSAIRHGLVFAVAILPGGALFWFAENYIPHGNGTFLLLKIILFMFSSVITVLSVFLGLIFIQRWSLAGYYRALGNGVQKSFSLSAKATKGFYTGIISFKCSFIGWGILSLLVVPLFWTLPYYSLSMAIYAKYLMERYEHSLAETPFSAEAQVTFEETD